MGTIWYYVGGTERDACGRVCLRGPSGTPYGAPYGRANRARPPGPLTHSPGQIRPGPGLDHSRFRLARAEHTEEAWTTIPK